jgi:hypothetical protein
LDSGTSPASRIRQSNWSGPFHGAPPETHSLQIRGSGDFRDTSAAPSIADVLPAAALAGLLVYFLTKPPEQVAQPNVTTAGQRTVVSAADVEKQVTDNLSNLHQTLAAVTDTASAQAALPKLREAAARSTRLKA